MFLKYEYSSHLSMKKPSPVSARKENASAARSRKGEELALPRRVPKQARSRARVDAILGAARKLIGEGGEVTMSEIADAAHVPIASLYQYFPDKTALVRALMIRLHERLRMRLEQALELVTRAEDIPAFAEAMLDALLLEFGAARPHLNIWAAAQASEVLRELDVKDALELTELVTTRFQKIAPFIDAERIRDTCVFAVAIAGPVARQSFLMPKADGERMLRELKALIRLRVETLMAGAKREFSA
ncbi:MAG TPA: helix-turn-helix domain-containing protein [Polyangiaceae bacterium]|nr:helix-turn-helix domain-containing protein [Polyangiaceae bacterium]